MSIVPYFFTIISIVTMEVDVRLLHVIDRDAEHYRIWVDLRIYYYSFVLSNMKLKLVIGFLYYSILLELSYMPSLLRICLG